MFKVLVLQTLYTLSDDQTEYQLQDRLSFMRFVGLALHDPVPDANTIWLFREALTRARMWASRRSRLFERFNAALAAAGAGIVPLIRPADSAAPCCARPPSPARSHVSPCRADAIPGSPLPTPSRPSGPLRLREDHAKPGSAFCRRLGQNYSGGNSYKNHIGIDRRHRLIRGWTVTDAARHDWALLPEMIDRDNTASDVWADTAYRSKANEKFLAGRLLRSQIHRKKPQGPADVTPHRPGQCPQTGGALGRRARLRPPEGANGPVHLHHRPRPSNNQDRLGQPRLQSMDASRAR